MKPQEIYLLSACLEIIMKHTINNILLGLCRSFFRLSQITKFELLQKQPFWTILVNFSKFSTKFTQNMANHVVKPPYNFSQPACRVCVLLPRLLLVHFFPILCSLYTSIVNICLFGSRSTLEALWEGNIPLEIGHISDMKTNVSNVLLALSS